MQGFGARLVARAKELGLSQAEVARRAGLSERRFGNYVTDIREPDLHTLTILAKVLVTSVDKLLGLSEPKDPSERDQSIAQIAAAVGQLSDSDLEVISVQLRAVAEWRTDERKG